MLRPFVRTALVLGLLAWFFPSVNFSNWVALLIASLVVTILFSLIKPILKLVFLPINIVTMGLASTVINVLLLWLATYLVPGFTIEPTIFFGVPLNSFFTLLVISFLITLLQGLSKFIF